MRIKRILLSPGRSKASKTLLFAVLSAVQIVPEVSAFTQKSGKGLATPMGHEFLCVESARQLGKSVPELGNQSKMQIARVFKENRGVIEKLRTLKSKLGSKSNMKAEIRLVREYTAGKRYTNLAALSAAVGQRWVDLMGFSVPYYFSCFNAVAQLPNDIMPDHFMRRHGDVGPEGRRRAHAEGVRRLRVYFLRAVQARSDLVPVVDASVTQGHFLVQRDTYLLGRAFHLLQDSFSPEHTIRTGPGLRLIAEIKHYGCLTGTFQHSHAKPLMQNRKKNGDIIWLNWTNHKLTRVAQAALRASKDLWRAFYAAKANPSTAHQQIDKVIAKWFRLTTKPPKTPTLAALQKRGRCKGGWQTPGQLLATERAKLHPVRRNCLIKYSGSSKHDPLKPPYYWEHKKFRLNSAVERLFWSR
jgi:hypothetical protein